MNDETGSGGKNRPTKMGTRKKLYINRSGYGKTKGHIFFTFFKNNSKQNIQSIFKNYRLCQDKRQQKRVLLPGSPLPVGSLLLQLLKNNHNQTQCWRSFWLIR